MTGTRIIYHIDMDAFYTSIEQRDNPSLRGRPVIVGSDPMQGKGRGVVAACSYEARKFGVHSAQPISQAWRVCPGAVFLRPSMGKYQENSRRIQAIFREVSPSVEPLSIDEAFLDMSDAVLNFDDAIRFAYKLKRRIHKEEGLTASVGIAANKFLAKIASDMRKPNGVYAVRPDKIQAFLDPLPIAKLWGVGPKTESRLNNLGIDTVGQLREPGGQEILTKFGRQGKLLAQLARGIDDRPLVTYRNPKSAGHEHTFAEDTRDRAILLETLHQLGEKVALRLQKHGLQGRTVCLKLRYENFTTITRQSRSRMPVGTSDDINRISRDLFLLHWDRRRKIRLIGVSVSSLVDESTDTGLPLFPRPDPGDLVF